jgi:hypothetical protein
MLAAPDAPPGPARPALAQAAQPRAIAGGLIVAMKRAAERMNFLISTEPRVFRSPGCRKPNIDVAALRNVGLSCTEAIDIIAAVAREILGSAR